MAFNSYIAAHSSSAGADLLLNPYEVMVLMTFIIIMTTDFFSKLLHTYTTASEIMITGEVMRPTLSSLWNVSANDIKTQHSMQIL